MQLVYERYRNSILRMFKDDKKAILGLKQAGFIDGKYPVFRDFMIDAWKSSPDISQDIVQRMTSCLDLLNSSGNRHYVIASGFSKALIKSSQKLNIETIPATFLIGEDVSFQVSLPGRRDCFVIELNHSEESNEFNLLINRFCPEYQQEQLNDPDYQDFTYWILKLNKSQTCKEALDDFLAEMNKKYGKQKIAQELEESFNLIVNLIIYINSGNPDIRHMRSSKKSLTTNNIKKLRNNLKETRHDYVTVGFDYKKETLVNGFFRWQAHGPRHSLRKLIWVDSFPRGGK